MTRTSMSRGALDAPHLRKPPKGRFNRHFKGNRHERVAMLADSLNENMRQAMLNEETHSASTLQALRDRGLADLRSVSFTPRRLYVLERTELGRDVVAYLRTS